MDHYIYPSEFALLLVWLTAPPQVVMLIVLSVLGFIRGAFASVFRLRSVVILIAAYLLALVLTVPVWLVLPYELLPPEVLPDGWPSLPPLSFAPAWMACSVVGSGTWVVLRKWLCIDC